MSRGSTPRKDILKVVLEHRKFVNELRTAKRRVKSDIEFINTKCIYDRTFELPPGVTWQIIRTNIERHLRFIEHQLVEAKFIYRKEHKRLTILAA